MLQPLRSKVLVEILQDNRRTESGLYIADTVSETPHRGKVISLGLPFMDKKGRTHAWGFKEGHIVHFKRLWEGEKNTHYVLKYEQIYAVEYNYEAFAIAEYVIVKRVYTGRIGDSSLIIPDYAGIKSNIEEFYGDVISVGRDNKMGINIGDKIIYHRNEGLSVKIPLKEELWSLKPRHILAII